jgi:hypothetical protein
LIKCPCQTSQKSISKVKFFLSGFVRRVKQAQTNYFWTSTFKEISRILKNFEFFGLFFGLWGRGAPFGKVVEQKLFLMSFRNFLDYSVLDFCKFRFSISLALKGNSVVATFLRFQATNLYIFGLVGKVLACRVTLQHF